MQFKIASGELSTLLQNQSKVVPTVYNEMPVLTYFLFEIQDSNLYVTGSDGMMRSRGVLPVIASEGNATFAVHPKDILEYVKGLPDQPLLFDYEAETSTLLMTFEGGYIRFATSDGELYPKDDKDREEAETAHVATMSASAMRRGLDLTIGSMAEDARRPILASVCFDFKAKYLAMVATSTEILTKYTDSTVVDPSIVEPADVRVQSPYQFCLPQKMANFLRALLASFTDEEVTLSHTDRKAFFKVGNIEASTRLVEGRYPPYDSVIPRDNPHRISIEGRLFVPAIKRMNSFMSSPNHPLVMQMSIEGNLLTVSMDVQDVRQAEQRFPIENPSNLSMKLRFKVHSFIALINTIESSNIVFEIADASRAMVIIPSENPKDTELTNVIMPITTAR